MSDKVSDERLEAAETRDPDIKTILQSAERTQAQHYKPQTDEERALDKRVNRKLDWIVLSLLAIEFIVGSIPSLHRAVTPPHLKEHHY